MSDHGHLVLYNFTVADQKLGGYVYSIQHYVIKFVSDITSRWFSSGTPVSSKKKTECHDITDILLKVALNS